MEIPGAVTGGGDFTHKPSSRDYHYLRRLRLSTRRVGRGATKTSHRPDSNVRSDGSAWLVGLVQSRRHPRSVNTGARVEQRRARDVAGPSEPCRQQLRAYRCRVQQAKHLPPHSVFRSEGSAVSFCTVVMAAAAFQRIAGKPPMVTRPSTEYRHPGWRARPHPGVDRLDACAGTVTDGISVIGSRAQARPAWIWLSRDGRLATLNALADIEYRRRGYARSLRHITQRHLRLTSEDLSSSPTAFRDIQRTDLAVSSNSRVQLRFLGC